MGCLQSKSPHGNYILDNEKEGIHILDGDQTDYYSEFLEEKVLGEGEFGQVKLVTGASGLSTGKQFAAKIIKKGYVFKNNTILTPVKPEYIVRECQILKALNGMHHTMKLVGLYEGAREIYIVSELLTGGEMRDWLVKKETSELRTEDVSRIAHELLDAINYCHSKGVIHRDLKPENVMFEDLSDDASLKIIDFGSSSMDPSDEVDLTHNTFAGSAFYVSPEMFLQMNKTDKTPPYSAKTDIWSIGVMLYVLVAGYPADSLQKAFNVIQKPESRGRDLLKLPNLPEDLPDEFIDLLNKSMCYKHKSRPSAFELLNHEFVKFHERKHDLKDDNEIEADQGLNILDIVNVANGASDDVLSTPKSSGTKTLTSRALRGSIARHSMYLDFAKFERSLTSLLAALLSEADYEALINKLESLQKTDTDKAIMVIPVKDLKKILASDFKGTAVETIDQLKGAFLYDDYAYHISKLRLFSLIKKTYNVDDSIGNSSSYHRKVLSSSDHKGSRRPEPIKQRSVHGSNVYKGWAKQKKAGLQRKSTVF